MNRSGSAVVTLPTDTEILMTRVFDAPPAMVFRAWTTPELVRRWWGSPVAPVVKCDIDLRVGGSWRYVVRAEDGTELGWHGIYRDIASPHRLVSTEVFEGYPDGEAVNTMVLAERDGTTLMSVTVAHRSKENRDGHVNSGMEAGMQPTLDRIDAILHELSDTTGENDTARRYRNVAGAFTDRVRAVPAPAWDNPAPCEGWVARDVVRHLAEWVPALLRTGAGVELPAGPSVDDDPVAAWTVMSNAIQSVLDDPGVSTRQFVHPQAGTHPLDTAIGMFILGDVLIHTWDLSRATGLDETIDPDEAAAMLEGLQPYDAALRMSGHYGPRVEAADGADTQARLIAFTGRQP